MIQFNECFSNGLESDSEWAVSTNFLSEIRFGNLFRTQIGRNQEIPTSLEPSWLNCYGEINQRGEGTKSSGPVSIATLSTSSILQLFMRGIHSHKLKGPELRWWNYPTGIVMLVFPGWNRPGIHPRYSIEAIFQFFNGVKPGSLNRWEVGSI